MELLRAGRQRERVEGRGCQLDSMKEEVGRAESTSVGPVAAESKGGRRGRRIEVSLERGWPPPLPNPTPLDLRRPSSREQGKGHWGGARKCDCGRLAACAPAGCGLGRGDEGRRGGQLDCGTDADALGTPRNAASQSPPLILQQRMQQPLEVLQWRFVLHFRVADPDPATAGDGLIHQSQQGPRPKLT